MFSSESAFASMQAGSENWMLKCANCGFEQSIWSLDGIRYAALGNPKTIRACPNCGQRSTHGIYKNNRNMTHPEINVSYFL